MENDDLDLSTLVAQYPKERFASTRLGIPVTRFATRTGGEGWSAEVEGAESPFRVINVSRIGIALEGPGLLDIDRRYTLRLKGPSGASTVDFYVLRRDDGADGGHRMAGLFTELLDRDDLPA
jgi:hypothetical protein